MSAGRWQPECDTAALLSRAQMLKKARAFFDTRGYLEVQTPSLSRWTASEPFLDSYEVSVDGARRYLQTSPEFHMKRLLAASERSIYQICTAFRRGETGRLHNSEFTMVEWYAPGTSASDMAELTAGLVAELYEPREVRHVSFRKLILDSQGVDISTIDEEALIAAAQLLAPHANQANALDVLYEHALSNLSGSVVVAGFPESLASLAAIRDDGLVDRFEFIINGVEIANGCRELLDATEYAWRIGRNNALRRAHDLPQIECDPCLEAALCSGLAPISGVALGLDRLLMLKLGKQTLSEVLAFSDKTA